MNRSAKLLLWTGCSLLLGLALLGHWYFWYAPRARTGSPDDSASTTQLFLSADEVPLRLWIPFPHQNLGALERAIESLHGLSGVSSYVLAQDLATLPSFGPFRLPPARDLVIAGSPDGDRIVVAASVYPLVARLARVAGRLAGNPWLSGGSVELQGRTVEVEGLDGRGRAAQGGFEKDRARPVLPDLEPTHALLNLSRPFGPVPGGLYRLDVGEMGWRIVNAESEVLAVADSSPHQVVPTELALVAASADPGSARDSTLRMFVMLAGQGGATEQIARAVVAHRGPGERWPLPAEKLLSGLGFEVSETAVEGWSLAAYDASAIRAVSGQLASISGLLGPVEEESLDFGIWMDLDAARGALDGLVRALNALPLPASEQVRMWTMAAHSVASLDSAGSLSLRIEGQPRRLELRFEKQSP